MIGDIDYGLGNLRSVAGAIEALGETPVITNNINELEKVTKLILPGVGAFGDGMNNLNKLELSKPFTKLVFTDRKPILGICLGFQLIATHSVEFGHNNGLDWLDMYVDKLDVQDNLRIPHIGWNNTIIVKSSPLFENIKNKELFYYVHSYQVKTKMLKLINAECLYGKNFIASVSKENIFGTQFHPEKSQKAGLQLLNNFIKNC